MCKQLQETGLPRTKNFKVKYSAAKENKVRQNFPSTDSFFDKRQRK